MKVLQISANLIRPVFNPKNYMPLDDVQSRTEMPDTLILDDSGRVKVDYGNEEVRRRIHKVLSDLKEFRPSGFNGFRHTR